MRLEKGIVADRIIPARAGFTGYTTHPESPSEDHPRSRGVYPYAMGKNMMRGGSSPLARGLPTEMIAQILSPRIIPARAGFT